MGKQVDFNTINNNTVFVEVFRAYPCVYVEDYRMTKEAYDAIPDNINVYYLAHGDNDWSSPLSIKSCNILCNYFGILFSREEIPLASYENYYKINGMESVVFEDDDFITDMDSTIPLEQYATHAFSIVEF